jgi:chorismate mutase/prephenate dehydratase
LFGLLEPFAKHGVNLTAVQSRPMKGKPWEYLFFVDLEGHLEDASMQRALDDAAQFAHSHKLLGSYPAGSQSDSAGRPAQGAG